MCGSTRSTTSPSSSSTRRSTPCAAGCCGPKLMVKLRSAVSVMRFSYSPLTTIRHSLLALRLLIPRQRIMRPLPGRQEIEVAELLRELHRIVDHPLLLVVPAHLDEPREGKVLAQRVSFETVVGQEAA